MGVRVLLQHQGQVYIPLINYLLMTLCLIIVGTFKTSVNIGKAYGAAKPPVVVPCKRSVRFLPGLPTWRMHWDTAIP